MPMTMTAVGFDGFEDGAADDEAEEEAAGAGAGGEAEGALGVVDADIDRVGERDLRSRAVGGASRRRESLDGWLPAAGRHRAPPAPTPPAPGARTSTSSWTELLSAPTIARDGWTERAR